MILLVSHYYNTEIKIILDKISVIIN